MPKSLRRECGFFFAIAALVLLLVFAFRTTGFHCDENNYLSFAPRSDMGDARLDGKQPLFYELNFALSHSVGYLIGPFRYWAPALVYLLFAAYALAWLTTRLPLSALSRRLFFAVTLLSPLFLLNATQVMMEGPMLALECFLFAALLPETTVPISRRLLPWTVVPLVLLKESALPALVAFGAAAFFWDRARAGRLVKWTVIALLVAKAIRLLTRVKEQWYGGFSTLLQFSRWPGRLPKVSDYFQTWDFFVGLILALAMVVAFRKEATSRFARGCLAAGVAAFALTLVVPFSVVVDFARYLFPLLWVGVLCWTALAAYAAPPLLNGALVLLMALHSTGIVWRKPLAGWPSFVADEQSHSYLTLLTGFPARAWTLGAQARFRSLCVFTGNSDEKARERIWHYFEAAFPGTKFFDDKKAFEACEGPKAIVIRAGEIENCACPTGDFRVSLCREEPLRYMGDPAIMKNLVCLP